MCKRIEQSIADTTTNSRITTMLSSIAATRAHVQEAANPRLMLHLHVNLHQGLRKRIAMLIDVDQLRDVCAVIVLHLRRGGGDMMPIAAGVATLMIEMSAIGLRDVVVLRQSRCGCCSKRHRQRQWKRKWEVDVTTVFANIIRLLLLLLQLRREEIIARLTAMMR